jgi:MSHA biogenesis protein MshK
MAKDMIQDGLLGARRRKVPASVRPDPSTMLRTKDLVEGFDSIERVVRQAHHERINGLSVLMRALVVKGWMLLSLSAIPIVSSAQTLVDPTKPPSELSAPAAPNELQSIIISPSRRAAIISGQTVELGGKVGDVRLIEVSEGSVVLQGAKERQILTLFPNVKIDKKAALLPMEYDVKSSARKKKLVNKSTSQAGKKEEK